MFSFQMKRSIFFAIGCYYVKNENMTPGQIAGQKCLVLCKVYRFTPQKIESFPVAPKAAPHISHIDAFKAP